MSNETHLTIIGNLTATPEVTPTKAGKPVVNFTVASTPRTYDKQAGRFVDGTPLFMRCTAWGDIAHNIAETLTKGTRVVVQGRLKARSFTTKDGDQRTVTELDVDEIGPSLRFLRAQLSEGFRSGPAPQGWRDQATPAAQPAQSQWGQQPTGVQQEPPF